MSNRVRILRSADSGRAELERRLRRSGPRSRRGAERGSSYWQRPPSRRPLRYVDQLLADGEVLSSVRKAAQAPGSKRNVGPGARLSRTPMRSPARRAVSTQCPLLMLYELFRQSSPRLHSSLLSPTGILSAIYNPSVRL